jgi:hypothetical protein
LEATGSLLVKIVDSAVSIYQGRRWALTDGLEREGRISYQEGLATAMTAFQAVGHSEPLDLQMLLLAEGSFLRQEQKHCDVSENQTAASLAQAIQSFDDALLALQVVANSDFYKFADMTHPHNAKHRVKGMPRDAFHEACISHRTRIDNILRSPGIDLAEKELLKLRQANLAVAQSTYLEKQRAALLQATTGQKPE